MAKNQKVLLTESVLAAEAMANIYRFIKPTGLIAGLGERPLGVLQAETSSGEYAPVATHGIVLVEAGGVVAANARVMSNASGKAITHVANQALIKKATVTAQQALASTITLTDGTGLSIAVLASDTYLLKARLKFSNEDAVAAKAVKVALSLPAGASAAGFIRTIDSDTTPVATEQYVADLTAATALGSMPASGSMVVEIIALVTISTTAGNIKIQWAPNASDTEELDLEAGGIMETNLIVDSDSYSDYDVAGVALDASSADGDLIRIKL